MTGTILLLASTAVGADVALRLEGRSALSADKILEQLRVRGLEPDEAAGWSQPQLERAAETISRLYRSRGYPLVRVHCLQPPPDRKAVCRILEGPRARLREVDIRDGAGKQLDQLTGLFPLGDLYDPAGLQDGLIRLEMHYHERGFPDARARLLDIDVVEMDATGPIPLPFLDRTSPAVRARLQIVAGDRFVFGTARVPAEVAAAVDLPETGADYSRSRVLALRQDIARLYLEQGLLLKRLEVLEDRSDAAGRIDLSVHASVYPELIVSRIEFEGAVRYPDDFYRRELLVEEEKILDPRELEDSLRRLAATAVLKDISGNDVEMIVDPNQLRVDLTFNLRERKRQSIVYSLGSDPLGGLGVTLFYSVANLLGLGERLGLEVSAADQTSSVAVGIASRFLFGTDVPLGLALQFFSRRTGFRLDGLDDRFRRLLGSRQTGLSTQLAYRISERQRVGLRAGAARFQTGQSRLQQFVLEPYWRRESRDGADFFRLGQRFSILQGQPPSWNLRHSVSGRRRLATPAAGELSVGFHAGHASFFGNAPVAERLFFEPFQLRGFTGATSGPWAQLQGRTVPAGADTLMSVSGDYQRSLRDGWELASFVDAGYSASLVESAAFRSDPATRGVVRTSLGAELRARPLASLPRTRLIFAFNPLRLDRVLSDGAGRLVDPRFRFRIAIEP